MTKKFDWEKVRQQKLVHKEPSKFTDKKFLAKFTGTCERCGEPTEKGTVIAFDVDGQGKRHYRHTVCPTLRERREARDARSR